MQKGKSARIAGRTAQKKRAQAKKRMVRNSILLSIGILLVCGGVFVASLLSRTSSNMNIALDPVQMVYVDTEGRPMYTPVPTPTPTPSPTPKPTPTPSPTPAPTPTPDPHATTDRGIDPNKKMVAITYDDGPHQKVTDQILKILKDNDVKATFFMLGSMAKSNPEVGARIAAAGHQIASHTYDHPTLTKLSDEKIKSQMQRAGEAIEASTGIWPTTMRPPGGAVNKRVREVLGMPVIYWSVDTLDWKHRNPKKTYDIVMKEVQDGSIILMHDIHAPTIEASEKLIPALLKKGYQLVTIDELFEFRGPKLEKGVIYYSANKKSDAE